MNNFQMLANDNIGFTRQIVVIDNVTGDTIVVANLHATLTANGLQASSNYHIEIIRDDIVRSNYEEVESQVQMFKDEVKRKAESLGLLYL